MDRPISVDDGGLKIKPELMKQDRIYHCVYENRALLFFLDEQKFLNCYEIDEPELVDIIKQCDEESIEAALKKYGATLTQR